MDPRVAVIANGYDARTAARGTSIATEILRSGSPSSEPWPYSRNRSTCAPISAIPQSLRHRLAAYDARLGHGRQQLRAAPRHEAVRASTTSSATCSTPMPSPMAAMPPGAVVAGPTLRGIELMDDPWELPDGYDEPLIWSGLRPDAVRRSCRTYRSRHPEAAAAEKIVSYMEARQDPLSRPRGWRSHRPGRQYRKAGIMKKAKTDHTGRQPCPSFQPRHRRRQRHRSRRLPNSPLATHRLTMRRLRDMLPGRIAHQASGAARPDPWRRARSGRLADNKEIAAMLVRLPSPYTRADALGFVEIIAQRADERPYAITLNDQSDRCRRLLFSEKALPELGYWLGEPYWGKGYMTEAVRALIEAAHRHRPFCAPQVARPCWPTTSPRSTSWKRPASNGSARDRGATATLVGQSPSYARTREAEMDVTPRDPATRCCASRAPTMRAAGAASQQLRGLGQSRARPLPVPSSPTRRPGSGHGDPTGPRPKPALPSNCPAKG